MATIPIFNPQIPFLGQLPGKLRIGSTLKIRARLNNPHNRLNINIQKGPALRPRDDVILHVSIRGDERVVVRNTQTNQVWGSEERYGGFPIHGVQSFEVTVTAEPNHFRITINGHPFCTFSYRISVHLAEFVSFDGQAAVESVTMEPSFGSNPVYPPVHPIHPPIHVNPGFPVNHYPPAPPPMPAHPPPYPGHYPDQATPYSEKKSSSLKVAAGAGVVAGITAVALANATRNLRRRKC